MQYHSRQSPPLNEEAVTLPAPRPEPVKEAPTLPASMAATFAALLLRRHLKADWDASVDANCAVAEGQVAAERHPPDILKQRRRASRYSGAGGGGFDGLEGSRGTDLGVGEVVRHNHKLAARFQKPINGGDEALVQEVIALLLVVVLQEMGAQNPRIRNTHTKLLKIP